MKVSIEQLASKYGSNRCQLRSLTTRVWQRSVCVWTRSPPDCQDSISTRWLLWKKNTKHTKSIPKKRNLNLFKIFIYLQKWHRVPYWLKWDSTQQHQLHIYYDEEFCEGCLKSHQDSWLLNTYDCRKTENWFFFVGIPYIQLNSTGHLECKKIHMHTIIVHFVQIRLYADVMSVI